MVRWLPWRRVDGGCTLSWCPMGRGWRLVQTACSNLGSPSWSWHRSPAMLKDPQLLIVHCIGLGVALAIIWSTKRRNAVFPQNLLLWLLPPTLRQALWKEVGLIQVGPPQTFWGWRILTPLSGCLPCWARCLSGKPGKGAYHRFVEERQIKLVPLCRHQVWWGALFQNQCPPCQRLHMQSQRGD